MISTSRIVRDGAVGALAFQVAHFVEHGAQLAYWVANPGRPPWLTPWATSARNVLAIDGTPGGGNEILHLIGNVVFLVGIVGMVVLVARAGHEWRTIPGLRAALVTQGIHVAEHVALTASYFLVGSAIGVSTWFGTLDGALGSSVRVWAHFLLNLAATYYALRGAVAMHRRGLLLTPSRRTALRPAG